MAVVVFSVWLTWIGLALTAGLLWSVSSSDVLNWSVGRRGRLEVELEVVVVVVVGEEPALLRRGVRLLR